MNATATVPDDGTISYAWYSSTVPNISRGKAISGATKETYTPPTTATGTTYYYCVITNTNSSATDNKKAKTTSAMARITVKAVAGIAFDNKTVTYNGAVQLHENAEADLTDGKTTYSYTPNHDSVLTDGKPQNAGSYTVNAKYESKTHIGNAIVNFTINKANATVTADDQLIVVGTTKPSYTATTTGLVGVETISNIIFTDSATNTSTKGIYTINPSDAIITGGGSSNYEINYKNGTLTIALAREIIDIAIASANAAKSNLTINSGPESFVTSGTKFVTDAEMQAIINAIAIAAAAKDTATTDTDAQTVATALNNAVITFKAAIKTGTKTYDGGGGSSGGGGGGGIGIGGGGSGGTPPNSAPIVSPPSQAVNTDQIEVNLETTVDANDIFIVKMKDITDAISKAKATANGITIVLNINGSNTAKGVNIHLPIDVQKTIINNKIMNTIFNINNPNIKIGMDLSAITEISKQAKTDMTLVATPIDSDKLKGNAKTAIGTRLPLTLRWNAAATNRCKILAQPVCPSPFPTHWQKMNQQEMSVGSL